MTFVYDAVLANQPKAVFDFLNAHPFDQQRPQIDAFFGSRTETPLIAALRLGHHKVAGVLFQHAFPLELLVNSFTDCDGKCWLDHVREADVSKKDLYEICKPALEASQGGPSYEFLRSTLDAYEPASSSSSSAPILFRPPPGPPPKRKTVKR